MAIAAEPRPIFVRLAEFDFRVRPPVFRVAPRYGEGPDFVIVNETELEARVDFLREDLVVDANDRPVVRFELGAGQTSQPLRVSPRIANGTYPYSISLPIGTRDARLEATGGSRPDMDVQN